MMWAVAELGVPHERIDVGDREAYRVLKPNDVTIEDDGLVLWESNAIVRYLAAKHGAGSLWLMDLRVRADADRWMDWSASTLARAISALRAVCKGSSDVVGAVAKTTLVVSILNNALERRPHVAGDSLSMSGSQPTG
jgi:glutathione S-transferase